MERSEFEEHKRRPEFDTHDPGTLFSYAKAAQQWIRTNHSEKIQAESIEGLVQTLEGYLSHYFQGLPEVQVLSQDVQMTVQDETADTPRTHTLPQPEGAIGALEAHAVTGVLYGFHRGRKNELRAYIDKGDTPIRMDAGIFHPLVSVAVEASDIILKEQEDEKQLRDNNRTIQMYRREFGSSVEVALTRLVQGLEERSAPLHERFNQAAVQLLLIDNHTQGLDGAVVFQDALFDYLRVKLGFSSPQSIYAASHKVSLTQRGFSIKGAAEFHNVLPFVDFMNERKSIGLVFTNEDGELVRIASDAIRRIHKTNPATLDE